MSSDPSPHHSLTPSLPKDGRTVGLPPRFCGPILGHVLAWLFLGLSPGLVLALPLAGEATFDGSRSHAIMLAQLLETAADSEPSALARSRSRWRWQRRPGARREAPPTAIAFDPERGQLAVGDADGVLVLPLDGSPETGVRHPLAEVLDLAFDAEGTLWVASARGLWRVDRSDRVERVALGLDDDGRLVKRVRAAEGLIVAATANGAFVSADGERFASLANGAARAPVVGVAIAREPGPPQARSVWLVDERRLFRALGLPASGGFRRWKTEERVLPVEAPRTPVVDVVADLEPAGLVLVYERAIAWLEAGEGTRGRWRVHELVLPPGALARRLGRADDRFWLATDRGLFEADRLDGPWQRSGEPAGTTAVVGLVDVAPAVREDRSSRLLVAGAAGLLETSALPTAYDRTIEGPAASVAATTASPDPSMPLRSSPFRSDDPPLAEVHRRALDHLDLGVGASRDLWRGLRRRGLWPEVVLRLAAGEDHHRGRDYDQTFSSGALHHLKDRSRDRDRDYEGYLELRWELGELAYPMESVDLSREVRQIVALRDDVLDEITQLYFERQRVLLARQAYADPLDPEAVQLDLRAAELAAGLDAWTGGWFGRKRRAATEAEE